MNKGVVRYVLGRMLLVEGRSDVSSADSRLDLPGEHKNTR